MRFTTLSDWLSWQETLHPQVIDLGLERVAAVWRRQEANLGSATVITVAGTNGKGSCVALLEAIYLAAGYRVGAYTSPHIQRYNERIRINGQMVSDDVLCQAFARVDQVRGDDTLSYFEFGTLAALTIFSEQRPDVVLLEVGLGGRLDAVNIIDADMALISSIDIDHSDWLGTDRDSIGYEKAGIFRQGHSAVCGDPDPPATLLELARQGGTALLCLGRDFQALPALSGACWSWHCEDKTIADCCDLPWPNLEGTIQLNNAASVLQVIMLLQNTRPVMPDAIHAGLRQVQLAGRYQRLFCCPPLQTCGSGDAGAIAVIVDVAHNPAAATALAQTLADDADRVRQQENGVRGNTRAVIGMLADKDVAAVLAALNDVVDCWYVAAPTVERACPVTVLLQALEKIRGSCSPPGVVVCASVREATRQALLDAGAGPGERLLVTGSFYTVAEFLAAVSS